MKMFEYGNSTFSISLEDEQLLEEWKSVSHLGGLTLDQLIQVVEENYTKASDFSTHESAHPAPTTRDARNSISSHGHVINAIGESYSQSVFCLATVLIRTTTADFVIPENTGGLLIISEDGNNSYASAVFNNDAGTLAMTKLVDSGSIISVAGTSIRITNLTGGTATYYLTFIGRNVNAITES